MNPKKISFIEFLDLLRTGIYPKAINFQNKLDRYYWNKEYLSYMNDKEEFFLNDLAESYSEYDLCSDDKIIEIYEDVGPLKATEAYWLKNFLEPFEKKLVYVEFKQTLIEICYINQFDEHSIITIPRPNEQWGLRTEPGKKYRWDDLF